MVGRIISVGRRSSRMLLITDYNSKVPVTVERSGDHAILEGDNSAEPSLRFLPLNPSFQVGDLVLTSGDGGLMPAGLLIGRISAVDKRKVAVTPFADWSRLDYVSVLLYDGLPPPESDPAAPIVPGGPPAPKAPATPKKAPGRSSPAPAASACSSGACCRSRPCWSRSCSTCCRCPTPRRSRSPRSSPSAPSPTGRWSARS
jgi:rod shape-determining protein MreC